MITREQVADLRPGDVVELRFHGGTVIRGPLVDERGWLTLAEVPWTVRAPDGGSVIKSSTNGVRELVVVSRAPRLYVNHPRTAPVGGDVAVCADGSEPASHTYHHLGEAGTSRWWRFDNAVNTPPKVMRLLVDGETGQVVP